MNWVSTNSAPYSPNVTAATAGSPAENERWRKKLRLSSGCVVILSQATNKASTARPAAPTPITRGEDQPWVGASMIDHRTMPMPAMDATAPRKSGALAFGVPRVWHQPGGGEQAGRGDGHVDQEDRAPPEVGQQQAADDRAEGHADADGTAPQGDRPLAFGPVAEHVADDGQRRGDHQRGADAHARPGGDEGADVAGEGRPGRARGEDRQAGQERLLAADPVGQAARGEQQAGEHEDVGVDRPLQVAGCRVQVADQRGERDVQDGVVQVHDQDGDAEDGQGQPAPAGRELAG